MCLAVAYCSKDWQVDQDKLVLGEPMKVPNDMSYVRMVEGKITYTYKPPSGMKTDEKHIPRKGENNLLLLFCMLCCVVLCYAAAPPFGRPGTPPVRCCNLQCTIHYRVLYV